LTFDPVTHFFSSYFYFDLKGFAQAPKKIPIGQRLQRLCAVMDQDQDWPRRMSAVQAGDSAAYRALLADLLPVLRALVRRQIQDRETAEDIVQDCLLTLHQVRHTYDATRPFLPWVAAIAKRRAIDHLRRQGRRPLEVAGDPETLERYADPASEIRETAGDPQQLHVAIAQLPVGQREAIELLKLGELSLKEASQKTGLSVGALKIAVHRAVKSLRASLTPKDRDPS
jgi:RNA polymerase sigma factor (sigma-70 family)